MYTPLAWLRRRWDDTGTFLLRNKDQRHSRYCRYQTESLKRLPGLRMRRLSDFQGQATSTHKFSRKSVLELPVEIRVMIWEHAFGGKLIALYREDRLLTHNLIDQSNSYDITEDHAVTPVSIQESLETLPMGSRNQERTTRSIKLGVLGSLRSCRTM